MKSILLSIIMITLLSSPFKAISEIYQWTDEDGNVHFSDRASSTEKLNEQEVPPEQVIFNKSPQEINKTTPVTTAAPITTAAHRKMLKLPDGSEYPIPRSEVELKKYKEVLQKIKEIKPKNQIQNIKTDHQSSPNHTTKIVNDISNKELTNNKKLPITPSNEKENIKNMANKAPLIEKKLSTTPSRLKAIAKNKTLNKNNDSNGDGDKNLPITSSKQKQTIKNMTSGTTLIDKTLSTAPSSLKETTKTETPKKRLANDKNLPITSSKQEQTIKNMTSGTTFIDKTLSTEPSRLKETTKTETSKKQLDSNKNLPITSSKQKQTIKNMMKKEPLIKQKSSTTPSLLKETAQNKTSNKQLDSNKKLSVMSSKQKQTIKNMMKKEPLIKQKSSTELSHPKEITKNKISNKKRINDKNLPITASTQGKIINSNTIKPLSEANKYLEMNKSKMIYGPARVEIKDTAYMDILYGQAFIPEDVTRGVFKRLNQETAQLAGAIVPGIPGDKKLKDNWGMIAIKVSDNGHIFDDKAENTDFSELLNNIKKSNQENSTSTHVILDWIREPIYNAKTHALSFSFNVLDNSNNYQDIYQTFLLGRTGLITFIYAANTKDRYLREPFVNQIMNAIKYEAGHRYEDYESKTDNLSNIELSNLITGSSVVTKKIGSLSVALDMLIKFWKIIIPFSIIILVLFKLCAYSLNPREK